jgi:hypothetical protein
MPTGFTLFGVLLLGFLSCALAVHCPHCGGRFPSCQYDSTNACPSVTQVTNNVAVVAAGVGALSLTHLIRPRYLRAFSRITMETILSLVKRAEPGTQFKLTESTSATDIMTAVTNGMVSLEVAMATLIQLLEAAASDEAAKKITRKIECLKLCVEMKVGAKSKVGLTSLYDTGVLTYIWAKVSVFVMQKGMQIKLNGADPKVEASSSDLVAKLERPSKFTEFAEMMNLFILFTHSLGVSSCMAVTDFFEHVVFDTIRLRDGSWQLAHELLLLVFRRIEDSGGNLTLSTAFDDIHLNSVLAEAEANRSVFFRTDGGNPEKNTGGVTFNGKFNKDPKALCCVPFNIGGNARHGAKQLNPDGSCMYAHVCNKWVSNKGSRGQCRGSEGTPGHSARNCDNPNRCDAPVA